jgi:hypothetical protein
MKHSNLYFGLVPPSGGWQSLSDYTRIFYKTHKHYKYLQRILEQKVFSKFIKNSKLEGLGEET